MALGKEETSERSGPARLSLQPTIHLPPLPSPSSLQATPELGDCTRSPWLPWLWHSRAPRHSWSTPTQHQSPLGEPTQSLSALFEVQENPGSVSKQCSERGGVFHFKIWFLIFFKGRRVASRTVGCWSHLGSPGAGGALRGHSPSVVHPCSALRWWQGGKSLPVSN